jgi:hypothetical protein
MEGSAGGASETVLAERRRLGADRRDEMWDGVHHLVPLPSGPQQGLSAEFLLAVGPVAKSRGLVPHFGTALFRAADDYRVPDQLYCRPEHLSERGAEGAELVVELGPDTGAARRKLGFYAALSVHEVLVLRLDDRTATLFRAVDGELRLVDADEDGGLHCDVLDVDLHTVDGQLRITGATGVTSV